jgi:hypothetical protein
LCNEIINFIKEKKINYEIEFSMISHSLGGLFSRNCLRWLYNNNKDYSKYLKPISFITISSPHLGKLEL